MTISGEFFLGFCLRFWKSSQFLRWIGSLLAWKTARGGEIFIPTATPERCSAIARNGIIRAAWMVGGGRLLFQQHRVIFFGIELEDGKPARSNPLTQAVINRKMNFLSRNVECNQGMVLE